MIRVGTRGSTLARTQSQLVADALARALGEPCELVLIRTEGDRNSAPLADLARTTGGTGIFVSALRDALLAGEVDVAVHSLKDLPTAPADGIELAAVPEREDPRDALVAAGGARLAELPDGARIGTGSPRRAGMLAASAARTGRSVRTVDLRGNVDTRLARVGRDLDAVVLAMAGLRRLGRDHEVTEVLSTDDVLPCPGQGALAVETRTGDPLASRVRDALEHPATRAAVTAERSLLALLDAGCSAPVGALGTVDDEGVHLVAGIAVAAVPGGTPGASAGVAAHVLRVEGRASLTEAASLGQRLGRDLLEVLGPPPPERPPSRPGPHSTTPPPTRPADKETVR